MGRWRKIVIEDEETQKPLSIGIADGLKGVIIIILVLISAAVLFANLSIKAYSIEDNARHVLAAIFYTGIHISYLLVVFNMLILDRPIEKIYIQRLIFPIILLFAYAFYAAQVWALTTMNMSIGHLEQVFKVISLLLFVLLYILWMLRDIFEYKEEKKPISIYWIIGEFVSLILLVIGIYNEVTGNSNNSFWTSLNGPIIICLVVYFFYRISDELFHDQRSYKDLYDSYLKYNITAPLSIDLNLSNHNQLKILDFGCGDGNRLVDILSWIKDLDKTKISITGCDSRKCFNSTFTDNMTKHQYTNNFVSNFKKINPAEYDIIILSHVLYEQSIANLILKFLKKCKRDTIILFRGASPKSFFVSTSFAGSNTISLFTLKRNRSHLWYSIWLDKIKDDAGLVRRNSTSTLADYTVEQIYNTEENNAIETANLLLKKLYRGALANRTDDYFKALKTYAGIDKIPNNDLIYIYLKT